MTQAAEDIIIILTQPPNSTAPSLREGDPICNALLDIAQQLKRVENIPEPTAAVQQSKNQTDATIQLPHNRAPPPRVDATKQLAPDTTRDAPPPRVEEPTPTPVSVLQQHSKLPENARFKNTPKHVYPLRSQQRRLHSIPTFQRIQSHARRNSHGTNLRNQAVQNLVASHIFKLHENNIYRPDGRKETINTILQGSDRHICTQSLSNE